MAIIIIIHDDSRFITLKHKDNYMKKTNYTLLLAMVSIGTSAQPPTTEEMWEVIQQQRQIINDLERRLEKAEKRLSSNEAEVEAANEAIEIAAEAIEKDTIAASKTSIGGYGELHYNGLEGDDQIDFHRFVLFFGHEFTDNVRFFSELELEHSLAGDGAPGEVELEQSWVELDITQQHRLRIGLDILPVGIINPTHEPNTFYGVERPAVEANIIPSTWWEAGIGLNGELAPGWNYDAVFHSGLEVPVNGSGAGRIRSGRQKVANANADHPAMTTRLRYTGSPGLELGGSLQYQSDITAGEEDISATLLEGHLDWKHRSGFGLRALYARWELDDPFTQAADQDDEQYGYYIEPAYRFPLRYGDLGIFVRWSDMEYTRDNRREEEYLTLGLNYWPIENVAIKFDWTNVDREGGDAPDSINLGMGYEF